MVSSRAVIPSGLSYHMTTQWEHHMSISKWIWCNRGLKTSSCRFHTSKIRLRCLCIHLGKCKRPWHNLSWRWTAKFKWNHQLCRWDRLEACRPNPKCKCPWTALKCKWTILRSQWTTLRCQWTTLRCQRQTLRCQLTTLKCPCRTLRCPWTTLRCLWTTLRSLRTTLRCL